MKSILFFVLIAFSLIACKQSFEPIDYGKDDCTYCKMTIVDKRYATEMMDKKGKVFKFDDIACMMHYVSENKIPQSDIKVFVADYKHHSDEFLNARDAVYLHSDFFKSPMGGNAGAFANMADASRLEDSLHSPILQWNELKY